MGEKKGKEIITHPEKCAGCSSCQLMCSISYKEGFNPLESNIEITWVEGQGHLISFKGECNNCGLCVSQCAYGALELAI
jgi:Fe-S-cluster-containing hydrogenase component 2